MGFPHPDLKLHNNTPYGVLIWTTITPTTVTVTLYSTPYAKAEQTGKAESMNGVCRVVVTTRTRTYPDGHTAKDNLKATYRPTGKLCTGQPVPGEEEPPEPPRG
jgi:vancomycin resistance protein YoaR